MTNNGNRVTVRLYGPLRHAAGGRDVQLEAEAMTVKEALAQLAACKGPLVADMIFDQQGAVWPSLILLVNDEPADLREASSVAFGDVISVLMPLAGG